MSNIERQSDTELGDVETYHQYESSEEGWALSFVSARSFSHDRSCVTSLSRLHCAGGAGALVMPAAQEVCAWRHPASRCSPGVTP